MYDISEIIWKMTNPYSTVMENKIISGPYCDIEKLDDYDFYEDKTAEEYEEEYVCDCYPDLDFDKLGWIGNYLTIDYEAMARDDDYVHEVEGGVLVQR